MPNLNTLLDRCFLNGYVARLQDADDLAWFLTKVRGHDIPRYEVLGEMSRRFVAAVEKLAADQHIPLIEFERGQRKEEIAAPLFGKARLADREGRGPDRLGQGEGQRHSRLPTSSTARLASS